MSTEITEIPQEQKDQMPGWVDKWVEIGQRTDPIDFSAARDYVLQIYDIIKQPRPMVLYAESPKAAVELGVEFELGRKPTKSECKEHVYNFYGGRNELANCAYISFFRDVMGWENETLDAFELFEELCKNINNVWWGNGVAVIVDRPELIKTDDEGRQHSEEGPSLLYRDGYSICCWHGTRVPREWLCTPKEELDASLALTWENIEQRRCFSEIVGWDNVLQQLDTTLIDEDGDPEIGSLLEVELPDIGKERFLRVKCGTGRYFALPVPPEMQTALEAQAWTWNLDVNEFIKPEVRT